jgi:hypothetical protein
MQILWKEVEYVVQTSKKALFKDFIDKIRVQLDLANAPEFSREAPAVAVPNGSGRATEADGTLQPSLPVEWPPLDRFRLRAYNAAFKIGAEAYDVTTDGLKTLELMNISQYRPFILETRTEEEKFEEYYADGVGVCLDEYDSDNDCFLPPRRVRMKKTSTPADLLDIIATWVPYPRDEILLLKCTPQNFQDTKVDILPSIRTKTLKDDYYISDYTKLIFQRMRELGDNFYQNPSADEALDATAKAPLNRTSYALTFTTINGTIMNVAENEPGTRSKAFACHMNMRSRMVLQLNKPPGNAFSYKITTDSRKTIGSLRADVAQLFDLEVNNIRMLKSSFNGIELKDDNQKIGASGLVDNMFVAIMVGQILIPGTYFMSFSRYNPGIDTRLRFLPPLDGVLSSSTTDTELKNDCKSPLSSLTADVTAMVSQKVSDVMAANVNMYNTQGGYYETWETGDDDGDGALITKRMSPRTKAGVNAFQRTNNGSAVEHEAVFAIEAEPIDCLTPVVDGENSNVAIAMPIDPDMIEMSEIMEGTDALDTVKAIAHVSDENGNAFVAVGNEAASPATNDEKGITIPGAGPVEPNDFGERTTQPTFSNANFTTVPELDGFIVSEATLVWNLKLHIWRTLKATGQLKSGITPSHVRIREKVSVRADKIFRDGLTKPEMDAYLSSAIASSSAGVIPDDFEYERTCRAVLIIYRVNGLYVCVAYCVVVSPELLARCKTIRDADIRLYDNKTVCFTILEEAEYLGESAK